MTGVEILAMEEVAVEFIYNWSAFWITYGVVFGILVLIGIFMSFMNDDWENLVIGIIAGVFFGGVSGAAFGNVLETSTKYETQYKVTISDEVSMNDFLEKYEIIDQEGKIYTVRERDDLENGK